MQLSDRGMRRALPQPSTDMWAAGARIALLTPSLPFPLTEPPALFLPWVTSLCFSPDH